VESRRHNIKVAKVASQRCKRGDPVGTCAWPSSRIGSLLLQVVFGGWPVLTHGGSRQISFAPGGGEHSIRLIDQLLEHPEEVRHLRFHG
jgi:hypothetical protein